MRYSLQLRLWFAAALFVIVHRPAAAQTGANVLLVVNDATPAGMAIATEYQKRRGVPEANVCHVMAGTEETVLRSAYALTIELPVWRCISRAAAQDRILYIVLTKGVPIRISGSSGRLGTVASVDSELTLLYRRKIDQASVPVAGPVPNPYFAGANPISELQPFTHERHDIYLVTRLDAYTVEDALGLVRRGAEPSRDGRFVLDERASWRQSGNAWLQRAADRLRDEGFGDRVVFDDTSKVITGESNVLGYYSWGTNDPSIRIRHFQLGFSPGAIGGMFVSTDGRTFREPPAEWTPGEWADRTAHFSGSPQSLMPDLIREGITGIAGHVEEPYLDATIRPDILFPAYVRGMNLAEAFYLAMPYLSWQTIVVGDPLCAPFRHRAISETALAAPVDSSTELPARFSARRLAAMPKQVAPDAQRAYVRFESRLDRGDKEGAREALDAAIRQDARYTTARLALASLLEQDARYDAAIEQYRAILAYAPNEVVALNNLAYAVAVRKNAPDEALPLAERANALARDEANISDTLAWVLHLLRRDTEALPVIAKARTSLATSPDIRWHYAVILAELKDAARARQELEALFKLDPSAADRPDVRRLAQRLNGTR